MKWCVYILELHNGAYYTGITNNLEKRIKKHSDGSGSVYVRSNLPIIKVAYVEYTDNRSSASKREAEIKNMRRESKVKLIKDYQDRR